MADALISAPVAAVTGVAAASLIAVAARKVQKSPLQGNVALMGVLGAFVFAAQMINFTIPGTGSSGHIIGGLLLAALLGPWCGFLTLCSVLIVQCLLFADGGLLALGCNIINMAAMSCLVAYPLVFRPIVRGYSSPTRIIMASAAASVVGLELGALLVSVETVASGITALPFNEFLLFMLPIHLAIGLCEGIATGLVLTFVAKESPDLLNNCRASVSIKSHKKTIIAFAVAAVLMAGTFMWIASSNPDGLEWSIQKITGATELGDAYLPPTAVLPDYSSHFSGIIGGLIVMAMLWAFAVLFFRRKPKPLPK